MLGYRQYEEFSSDSEEESENLNIIHTGSYKPIFPKPISRFLPGLTFPGPSSQVQQHSTMDENPPAVHQISQPVLQDPFKAIVTCGAVAAHRWEYDSVANPLPAILAIAATLATDSFRPVLLSNQVHQQMEQAADFLA